MPKTRFGDAMVQSNHRHREVYGAGQPGPLEQLGNLLDKYERCQTELHAGTGVKKSISTRLRQGRVAERDRRPQIAPLCDSAAVRPASAFQSMGYEHGDHAIECVRLRYERDGYMRISEMARRAEEASMSKPSPRPFFLLKHSRATQ
eukprot:TRINITY_DN8494_c0_g1_i1.p1 TRINITY_DN8494_c0_g1~~TRINITY_DN8494_c0_g1_i1.p1  ORF type:complete len:147 (+),score=12.53 TRINITY_DN8494_c0_g1_i1:188-628(+)